MYIGVRFNEHMRRLFYKSTTKNTKKIKEGETTFPYSELNRFLIKSYLKRKNYIPLPPPSLILTTSLSTITTQDAFYICIALSLTKLGKT